MVDWTPKRDLSQQTEVTIDSDLVANRYLYRPDSVDANLKNAEANYDDRLHRAKFGSAENADSQNPFFAPTLMYFDASIAHDTTDKPPLIPVISSYDLDKIEEQEPNDSQLQPRILYWAGRREGDDGLVRLPENVAYDFPALWSVAYNLDNTEPSLAFSDETLFDGTVVQGLFRKYHLHNLARQANGKVYEEWAILNTVDILNLSFRNKVLIGGDKFLLQEVDGFKPDSRQATQIVLIPDVSVTDEDADKITHSQVKGHL